MFNDLSPVANPFRGIPPLTRPSRRLPSWSLPVLALLTLAAALLWLHPASMVEAKDSPALAMITEGPAIVSFPASGNSYARGEAVNVAITFSKPVVVEGKPRLRLAIGGKKRWARYDHSDQNGARLIFTYVVKAKDLDADGIGVGKNALDMNGGTIQDADGNRARLRHPLLPDQADHRVDGIPPTVTAVSIVSAPQEDNTYGSGDHIQAAVTFSEPVRIDGEARLRLAIGGKKRWARYAYSAADGARLVFAYVVKFKDQDDDGISIGKNALDLNDGSMRDAAGNAANLAHGKLPPDPAQRVDGGGGGERQGTVTAPAKPMDLWATGGNESITLTWCAPDSEHDNPTITKYQVKVGSGSWTDMEGSNGDPLLEEHTVTGLTNGTEYAIRIRAVNAGGEGVQSDEVKATPKASVPAKPAGLAITPTTNGAWLNWNDPADASMPVYQVWISGGGHAGEWEGYYPEEIEKRADGKLWNHDSGGPVVGEDEEICDPPPNEEDCGDPSPVVGVQYTYKIRAVNGNGPGPASDAVTGSPYRGRFSPTKPTGITTSASNGQVTLNWNNPSNSKIYGYLFRVASGAGADFGPITYVPGSNSATTSHTFTGLTNGTQYRFVIAAFYSTGATSGFSDPVTATPSE